MKVLELCGTGYGCSLFRRSSFCASMVAISRCCGVSSKPATRVVSWLNDKGKAMDFGCGTGQTTCFLKELVFTVYGMDIDHNMLEK